MADPHRVVPGVEHVVADLGGQPQLDADAQERRAPVEGVGAGAGAQHAVEEAPDREEVDQFGDVPHGPVEDPRPGHDDEGQQPQGALRGVGLGAHGEGDEHEQDHLRGAGAARRPAHEEGDGAQGGRHEQEAHRVDAGHPQPHELEDVPQRAEVGAAADAARPVQRPAVRVGEEQRRVDERPGRGETAETGAPGAHAGAAPAHEGQGDEDEDGEELRREGRTERDAGDQGAAPGPGEDPEADERDREHVPVDEAGGHDDGRGRDEQRVEAARRDALGGPAGRAGAQLGLDDDDRQEGDEQDDGGEDEEQVGGVELLLAGGRGADVGAEQPGEPAADRDEGADQWRMGEAGLGVEPGARGDAVALVEEGDVGVAQAGVRVDRRAVDVLLAGDLAQHEDDPGQPGDEDRPGQGVEPEPPGARMGPHRAADALRQTCRSVHGVHPASRRWRGRAMPTSPPSVRPAAARAARPAALGRRWSGRSAPWTAGPGRSGGPARVTGAAQV